VDMGEQKLELGEIPRNIGEKAQGKENAGAYFSLLSCVGWRAVHVATKPHVKLLETAKMGLSAKQRLSFWDVCQPAGKRQMKNGLGKGTLGFSDLDNTRGASPCKWD